jgi:hypothetical protein
MRRFALRLAGGLLACALLACVTLRHRQIQTQLKQPFGCYTSQQIIDRTLPLCQTILGTADGLVLSAEHSPTGRTGCPPLWCVQCSDRYGEYLAEFTWEAWTGELRYIGHADAPSGNAGSPPAFAPPTQAKTALQARTHAAWIAYNWLHRLGVAAEGSRWRLTRAPERSMTPSTDAWTSVWRSADHQANIKIGERSGALISVQSWPLAAPRGDAFRQQ